MIKAIDFFLARQEIAAPARQHIGTPALACHNNPKFFSKGALDKESTQAC